MLIYKYFDARKNAMKTKIFELKHLLLVCILFFAANIVNGQIPPGKPLLADGLHSMELFGVPRSNSLIEIVPVEGLTFSQAMRINTFNKPSGTGSCGLNANLTSSLQRGDVLWISFKARSLESSRETGESNFELRVDQLVNGKYVWPPYLERGVSFGKEWRGANKMRDNRSYR